MPELEIRPAAAQDLGALARLFERAFGTPLDPAEWRWKYDANPFGRCALVALADGRLVAHYGGWRWRLRGASGSLEVLEICDTMTDPSVRLAGRRPVLARMDERFVPFAREMGIAFCFGCPNPSALRFGTRWLGYEMGEPMQLLSRPLPVEGELPIPGDAFLRLSDHFPEGHDLLAERLHAAPGWRLDRSRGVLNWRYHARPGRYYRVLHVGPSENDLRGFAVYQAAGPVGVILDLQAEGAQWTAALLTALARDLAPHGVRRLEMGLSRGPEAQQLAGGFGFDRCDDANRPGRRPISPDVDSAAVLSALSLRWGDLDAF